jgi:hypothetical protein
MYSQSIAMRLQYIVTRSQSVVMYSQYLVTRLQYLVMRSQYITTHIECVATRVQCIEMCSKLFLVGIRAIKNPARFLSQGFGFCGLSAKR